MARKVQEVTRKRPRKSQQEPVRDPTPEEEEDEEEEEEEEEPPQKPRRRLQTYGKPPISRNIRRSRNSFPEPEPEPEPEEEEDEGESGLRARKRGGQKAQKRRRRDDDDDSDEAQAQEDVAEQDEGEGDEGGKKTETGPVGKLLRLALAMEYQKKPIRRQDITEKVLGSQFKSDFKPIFDEAQAALKYIFGFEMVELPAVTEKISLAQQRRQAAAEAQRGDAGAGEGTTATADNKKKKDAPSGSKSWQLVSVLPEKYRLPLLLSPQLPDDQTILGLGSTIVALVYLSGRSISEAMLKRHLRKFGIDDRIPVEGNREKGKMDNIMAKLVREGYLVKLKDEIVPGQEQTHTYVVGPRGKLEVGRAGVTDYVKRIYESVDGQLDEGFDRRVNRAIGKEEGQDKKAGVGGGEADAEEQEGGGRGRGGGRAAGKGRASGGGRAGRRRRRGSDEDEEEEPNYDDDSD